jgi:hypothetical protein
MTNELRYAFCACETYDPVVPFTTSDACWCAPGTGTAHPHCPMHGEMPCILLDVKLIEHANQEDVKG